LIYINGSVALGKSRVRFEVRAAGCVICLRISRLERCGSAGLAGQQPAARQRRSLEELELETASLLLTEL
jgi:hypothetical protein